MSDGLERFVVTNPAGIMVHRQHFAQGTVVAFSEPGPDYQSVKEHLTPYDPLLASGTSQAAVVLDRAPVRLSGHDAGCNEFVYPPGND